jgi:hypothetical protein
MHRAEAKWVLLRKLVEYRRYSYEKLRIMVGTSQYFEIRGPSGTEYQIEVDVVWDDQPEGAIRVLAAVDDGRWRAFCPVAFDFLSQPTKRPAVTAWSPHRYT